MYSSIGWLLCCCASACCAGVLCAVLWARFLEVPALLALCDDERSEEYLHHQMPSIAVCPPIDSVAEIMLDKLSQNMTETQRIPITLKRLLTGKSTDEDQVLLLDKILKSHNMTIPQVLMNYSLNCNEYTRKCRYRKIKVPCEQLFEKMLTSWGVCCVMRPNKLANVPTTVLSRTFSTETIDLVLQCAHGSKLYSCQFITRFEGEEFANQLKLIPSFYYLAQLRFIAVPQSSNSDTPIQDTCNAEKSYIRSYCMLRCAEASCGCRDPLLNKKPYNRHLPICPVTRISCLKVNKTKGLENATCNCLPPCNKLTTYMVLESNPMNNLKQAIDPLYAGINGTASIVVNLRVNLGHSRVFVLNPTETWLTLLSSLGGVFNMFMGVGLFSALEFIYLILVKLPIAIRQSSEIDVATAPTTRVPGR
ncbi:unnamed protein product [Chrysodeixis includens]|uniref:Sodium channel protein Nach n=1 Tax=Chrysodeixis includens TaxID=689277 RepID=A0A9P0C595_CHRIL|nr:unnamed protein product [Chrysodeixis includens]